MTLSHLPPQLRHEPALARVVGHGNAVLAAAEPVQAFVLAGLVTLSSRRPLLVATPTAAEAERLRTDLSAFLGREQVLGLPAWETLPFERVSPSVATMGQRLECLWRLVHDPPAAVVAPIWALLQSLAPEAGERPPVTVRAGDSVDPEQLVRRLVGEGYRREYQVEHRGEVAMRGSIVDVFPSTSDSAVRMEFWGDEVERVSLFDVSDQRSLGGSAELTAFGCRELLPTDRVRTTASKLLSSHPWGSQHWEKLAQGLLFDGMESWLPWLVDTTVLVPDLLGPDALVVLVDPRRIRDRAAELGDEEASLAATLSRTWAAGGERAQLEHLHAGFGRLLERTKAATLSLVPVADSPSVPVVEASGWVSAQRDPAAVANRAGALARDGYAVVVCAEGTGSAARMSAVLGENGLEAPVTTAESLTVRPGVSVVVQPLERGFVLPSAKLALLGEADLTGRRRPHRRARARARAAEGFFDTLSPGDYVVHHVHGVGRYGGMVQRSIGGAQKDYLLIEYRGGDKLYVPSDQIDTVTPYSGGESPTLHRMGGADFARAKAKVRQSVGKIAEDLVALYRQRRSVEGHAFTPDTPWQSEMEQAFPWTETPDQAKAIAVVKADMERDTPMDRLVCGDVGFGKTEVAIRAAFKAVQDGFQVVVLVPTTLLAQQHFQTFSDRFAGYPVRVEVLSRFLTPAQARAVVDGVTDGTVDVVVGTHRLLSSDVQPKKLGLLVVDEEQRFGVTHKEAIKALSVGVDVLTLTATPIPRTLELSLTGIRDLTLLETPPAERQPILTYVGEYDELAVAEAVRRELLREGQVFFVHNRVADIDHVASRLVQLVPEAKVAVAHGQMDEGSLEQVVMDFWEGRFDVLVCTTIIESGIDMPTVNTLVVDRADALGLGQLHQLRGRVGRAGMRAYAYLFYPPDRSLSEEAYERLRTIGEHTELGSGFKIAMRDLQIRGAGNLLGADQSGHIAAVGYDLYVKMVSEAIAQTKGEKVPVPAEIKIDLPLEAHLPGSYVEREDLRLEAYRRLASVATQDEVEDVAREWRDRYGPPPGAAEALLDVARLRAECARTGVNEVTVARSGTAGRPSVRLSPLRLPASAQVRLGRKYPGSTYKADSGLLLAPLPRGTSPAVWCTRLLGELLPGASVDRPERSSPEPVSGPGHR